MNSASFSHKCATLPPSQATHFRVMRIDDNGNRFLIAQGLAEAAANELVAQFTARGHKQVYWAEMEMERDRQAIR